jgi:PAS domain-containing protein
MATKKELVASDYQFTLNPPRAADGAGESAQVMANVVGQNSLSEGSITLLATAIGQIGEAVVITDALATIQYVNPAFTRITGYTAEEAVGLYPRFLKSGRQDLVGLGEGVRRDQHRKPADERHRGRDRQSV